MGLITANVASNTPEIGHLSPIDRANLSRYIVLWFSHPHHVGLTDRS